MIEIFNVIFILIFFSILLGNVFILKLMEEKVNLSKQSSMNLLSSNLLIIMLAFLLLSFFKKGILILCLILLITSFIGLITNYRYILFYNKKFFKEYLIFFIICFILSVDIVANLKLEWDGHGWLIHTLNFKENYNFFDFQSSPRALAYNQPHLGAIFWSILWKISILDYEYFGRIFYIIVYFISIAAVAENISIKFINRVLIISILIFLTYDKFLFSGYQEILTFSIIVIICNYTYKTNLRKLSIIQLLFLYFSASLLLWTKNEGIIFFLIFSFYLGYFLNFKKKFFFLFLCLFLILLKFYMLGLNEVPNELVFEKYFTIFGELDFQKLNYILLHIIIAMFKYPIWVLFFIMLFLENDLKKNIPILYFISSSLIFIIIIYLIQEDRIFKWIITGSLDRVLFQASGFLVFYVANSINLILKRFKY